MFDLICDLLMDLAGRMDRRTWDRVTVSRPIGWSGRFWQVWRLPSDRAAYMILFGWYWDGWVADNYLKWRP